MRATKVLPAIQTFQPYDVIIHIEDEEDDEYLHSRIRYIDNMNPGIWGAIKKALEGSN